MCAELLRTLCFQVDEENNVVCESITTPEQDKVRACVVDVPYTVIPIILIPGIMASRLRHKESNELIWYPPEGLIESLVTALKYAFKSAKKRQIELDRVNTVPDDVSLPTGKNKNIDLALTKAKYKNPVERAQSRGWGQIYGKAYMPILDAMEDANQWFMMPDNTGDTGGKPKLNPRWRRVLEKQVAGSYVGAQSTNTPVLNDVGLYQEVQPHIDDRPPGAALGAVGTRGGAKEDFVCLSEDDLYKIAKNEIYLPVYAFGYNWLDTNIHAAAKLEERINEIIDYFNKIKADPPIKCEKVILVTHSMGGLVARLAIQRAGLADKVLGVVHGVMPATGAPYLYSALRQGFEGIEQIVTGKDARHTTAEIALAPGALELAPMDDYDPEFDPTNRGKKKKHWLRARYERSRDDEYQTIDLGDPADNLNSIFLANGKDQWWKMVKGELANPVGQEKRKEALKIAAEKAEQREDPMNGDEVAVTGNNEDDFAMYASAMSEATEARKMLRHQASSYHPNTYAYYGDDPEQLSYHCIDWVYNPRRSSNARKNPPEYDEEEFLANANEYQGEEYYDNLNGRIGVRIKDQEHVFELAEAYGSGDATVAAGSGAAPTEFCKQMFKHQGEANDQPSYKHSDSYATEIVQDVALYSIAKIVAEALK